MQVGPAAGWPLGSCQAAAAKGSECAQHESASWPGFLPREEAVSTDYQ